MMWQQVYKTGQVLNLPEAAGIGITKGNDVMKKNSQKPPLGAVPHWVKNRDRNIELADAISSYSREYQKPDNDANRNENILEIIRVWAMEIVLNCDAELELNKSK